MSREERRGHRKTRNERTIRIPELGYYLIVTDAEGTEPSYFTGLYNSMTDDIKRKLVIKVTETKTGNLVQKCLELINENPQYRIPWIVFDRDQVQNFDKIIEQAEENGINVGWSNPCFEIWMFAYYGFIPAIDKSWDCCREFSVCYKRKTGVDYSKSDPDLYKRLVRTGNEEEAIIIMKNRHKQHHDEGKTKPSDTCPCSTVYALMEEIREKKMSNR